MFPPFGYRVYTVDCTVLTVSIDTFACPTVLQYPGIEIAKCDSNLSTSLYTAAERASAKRAHLGAPAIMLTAITVSVLALATATSVVEDVKRAPTPFWTGHAAASHSDPDPEWEAFKKKYKKTFASPDEEAMRHKLFKESQKRVAKLNHLNGKAGNAFGINWMSDRYARALDASLHTDMVACPTSTPQR